MNSLHKETKEEIHERVSDVVSYVFTPSLNKWVDYK